MKIAVGLPNAVRGTRGEQIVDCARRAEERGFSSLGVIDRIVYDNYDPFTALAAAAVATERIGLATTVCIALPRGNDALVAKQALSVQALSGGRFTFGVGLGGRDDDYEAGGIPSGKKGERIDQTLETVRKVFAGEEFGFAGPIGPRADGPPPILVGGHVEASFKRAAKYGDGWILGGGTPEQLAEGVEGVRSAWKDEGRDGEPKIAALAYFSLGSDAERVAEESIGHYYSVLGQEVAGMISGSAAKDADTVAQYISGFEGAGCQELFFFPAAADAEQVDLLADAAGL